MSCNTENDVLVLGFFGFCQICRKRSYNIVFGACQVVDLSLVTICRKQIEVLLRFLANANTQKNAKKSTFPFKFIDCPTNMLESSNSDCESFPSGYREGIPTVFSGGHPRPKRSTSVENTTDLVKIEGYLSQWTKNLQDEP